MSETSDTVQMVTGLAGLVISVVGLIETRRQRNGSAMPPSTYTGPHGEPATPASPAAPAQRSRPEAAYPPRAYPREPHPGQPYPSQPYPSRRERGKPNEGGPYTGEPYPGEPHASQPYGLPRAAKAPWWQRWWVLTLIGVAIGYTATEAEISPLAQFVITGSLLIAVVVIWLITRLRRGAAPPNLVLALGLAAGLAAAAGILILPIPELVKLAVGIAAIGIAWWSSRGD